MPDDSHIAYSFKMYLTVFITGSFEPNKWKLAICFDLIGLNGAHNDVFYIFIMITFLTCAEQSPESVDSNESRIYFKLIKEI